MGTVCGRGPLSKGVSSLVPSSVPEGVTLRIAQCDSSLMVVWMVLRHP